MCLFIRIYLELVEIITKGAFSISSNLDEKESNHESGFDSFLLRIVSNPAYEEITAPITPKTSQLLQFSTSLE